MTATPAFGFQVPQEVGDLAALDSIPSMTTWRAT